MTNVTQEFSKDAALALAAELRATGLTDVRVAARDYVTPENTVGQRYSVEVVIRDAKHGNTVVRSLRGPAVAADVAKDIQREVKDRAKGTRSRVRAERDADKS